MARSVFRQDEECELRSAVKKNILLLLFYTSSVHAAASVLSLFGSIQGECILDQF